MACVGDELAQPIFAGLPAVERVFYVAKHPIERRAELADFGPGVSVGHPVGQVHVSAGQRKPGDLVGRGGDLAQRAQGQADDADDGQPGHQQRATEDLHLDAFQPGDRGVQLGQGQPGYVDVGHPGRGWQ